MPIFKIAVIGGGPSGLCAAKHAKDQNYDVTIYEQTSRIGGVWVYVDNIGEDKSSIPFHTSMYNGLKTNLPIECMGFPNFPFPNKCKSFVSHEEVLEFFESYARQFNLYSVIKFHHYVVRVRPVEETCWEVLTKNLLENTYHIEKFDAIFVCNGHYSEPYYPDIDGLKEFKGRKMHSHNYRRPEIFKDESILVIGAGPSGKDITYEISNAAKKVTLSHHRDLSKHSFPSNVTQRGDIKCFTATGVEFNDGHTEDFTVVLFCTGYHYSFPFLTIESGLCMNDTFYIHPLYKHVLNVQFPTMAIIGLQICAYTYMYDMQIRFCLKYWSGVKALPTKEMMLSEIEDDMNKIRNRSNNKRHAHLLGAGQTEYFYQLADLGEITNIPEVIFKIYDDCTALRIEHPEDYRNYLYTIIDDKTFKRHRVNAEIII